MILRNGMNDIKGCLSDAMDYCLYDKIIRFQKSYSPNPTSDALNELGIKFGDINQALKKGKILYDSISENAPRTSISIDMIFEFYKYEKSEFEIVCFLAFSALKSIIQTASYKKITNDYLLCRMSGISKNDGTINPMLKKYSSRYQLNKIKNELQLYWGLKYYANRTRGFYASFNMTLKDLAVEAERKNRKYKLKRLKEQINDARREATEQVMKEPLKEIFKNIGKIISD